MIVVLAVAEGLTMNNDLVLGIKEGLTVISLDSAVGGHHFGRIVVRKIALILSASGALLGSILSQPFSHRPMQIRRIFHPGVTPASQVIAQAEQLVHVIPVEFFLGLHLELPRDGRQVEVNPFHLTQGVNPVQVAYALIFYYGVQGPFGLPTS